ncbi:MAG: FAD-dependent oxidoreductase [Chlamydiota bacterium]|nr:FAD-dependent oxidoreductase [Chlamydiota bacterium]
MKIIIIGGVAGGASCAARLRRLSEEAEIIMFDRGPYVSFANCGLPYYVGQIITDEKRLLVATPELFKERFNIEVRLEHEVLSIDRLKRIVQVKDLKTGNIAQQAYDALVLSPGASPLRPPIPGIDLEGIFAVRTIPDSRRIRLWIKEKDVKKAVIIGGGFIGLEMAENLSNSGIQVSILEMLGQVLAPLDMEMVFDVHDHLRQKGVALHLSEAVSAFKQLEGNLLGVVTRSGFVHETQIVILAMGVQPETGLARDAGLELGLKGAIKVDESMRTNDPHIWAVGDAVEGKDFLTHEAVVVPLAGPANRQGRIAADSIVGRPVNFRGIQATAVCQVFDLTVATTGATEKVLKRIGRPYEKIYLYPGHHVSYYPGARPIHMKLIFDPVDGQVLGAQAVGEEGVEKRIDVISMIIQKQGSVFDLEEAELCYAPQYGAAKDPVNIAGMIAANVLRGDAPVCHWDRIDNNDALLIDVRDTGEYEREHVPGAMNIPLDTLRAKLPTIPKDRKILLYCSVGQRSYYATRVLRLNGLNALNLSGGFQTYKAFQSEQP